MKLGLIEYVGARSAPFEIRRGGGPGRLWTAANTPSEDSSQRRRWLPEKEAESYGNLPDFKIIRWGRERPAKATIAPAPIAVPLSTLLGTREAIESAPSPTAPPTIPLSVLLEAKQAEEEVETELSEQALSEQETGEYVISRTGVVHAADCLYVAKTRVATFLTMDDAAADPRFKKWHKCVRKE